MEEPKFGVVYSMQPEPADPAACRWFEAGAVRIGVEYRSLDPEQLRRVYADSPEDLAELEANSPEGGFFGAGVSLHVVGVADDHEYLRFDAFDDDPHYHYIHPGGERNHWVPFDPIAGGPILDFALGCLRERLAPMLVEAGGAGVAEKLDAERLDSVLDVVERAAREAAATPPPESTREAAAPA